MQPSSLFSSRHWTSSPLLLLLLLIWLSISFFCAFCSPVNIEYKSAGQRRGRIHQQFISTTEPAQPWTELWLFSLRSLSSWWPSPPPASTPSGAVRSKHFPLFLKWFTNLPDLHSFTFLTIQGAGDVEVVDGEVAVGIGKWSVYAPLYSSSCPMVVDFNSARKRSIFSFDIISPKWQVNKMLRCSLGCFVDFSKSPSSRIFFLFTNLLFFAFLFSGGWGGGRRWG